MCARHAVPQECCQAWMANPLVDCLERTIAGHRYVVDFQQLRIQRVFFGFFKTQWVKVSNMTDKELPRQPRSENNL